MRAHDARGTGERRIAENSLGSFSRIRQWAASWPTGSIRSAPPWPITWLFGFGIWRCLLRIIGLI